MLTSQACAAPGSRHIRVGTDSCTDCPRSGERELVLAAFADARLVTLVGPGGVGKTRLAAEVAEAGARSFPSGVAFVDLVPVRNGFVAQAVAATLGVVEGPQQPLESAIAEQFGRGRALLVMDNCEHLLTEVAGFVARLLSACPGLRVLVTTRERLGIPGERLVAIEPLPLASDAVALFLDRAAQVDPDFDRLAVFAGSFDLDAVVAVTGGDRAAVADVLGRLVDGGGDRDSPGERTAQRPGRRVAERARRRGQ